ncbi:MAG: ATP-dependent Clp protease ATP-binding subunit, partial [Deltaproteobacteria bacterium]|nr:ATP-dependent Clp protease ATP-binding subunit [Deltaproteobacteria bacterium]
VLAAHRRVILFIDEIHTLIGAGVGDGSLDASNDLKGALARGEFPCIGATTFGEYQQHIQPDSALNRRFEIVTLREPTQEEADLIIEGVASIYEKFHGVEFTQDALRSSVRLTDRFIADRSLPAKAIDLLDRAGARVGREARCLVERKDIVAVLAGLVDLPVEFLSVSPSEGLRGLDVFLREKVVGHDECVDEVSRILGQNWSRFGSRRPLGSFIFAGPKGVGKRTTAQAIAEFLFGSEQAFMDIDMSDYNEAHALSHLIGSPPGYVGHDEGGLLSDALTRRPFLVIQWRHVEQAHRSVQGLLTQILTEGTATDRRGRRMDFRNTVHVLTAGFDSSGDDESGSRTVGFGVGESDERGASKAAVRARCRRLLPGDLVAATDGILAFRPLRGAMIRELAMRLIRRALHDMERDLGVGIETAPELVDSIAHFCSLGKGDASAVEAGVTRLFSRPASDFLFANGPLSGRTVRASLGPSSDGTPTVDFMVVAND